MGTIMPNDTEKLQEFSIEEKIGLFIFEDAATAILKSQEYKKNEATLVLDKLRSIVDVRDPEEMEKLINQTGYPSISLLAFLEMDRSQVQKYAQSRHILGESLLFYNVLSLFTQMRNGINIREDHIQKLYDVVSQELEEDKFNNNLFSKNAFDKLSISTALEDPAFRNSTRMIKIILSKHEYLRDFYAESLAGHILSESGDTPGMLLNEVSKDKDMLARVYKAIDAELAENDDIDPIDMLDYLFAIESGHEELRESFYRHYDYDYDAKDPEGNHFAFLADLGKQLANIKYTSAITEIAHFFEKKGYDYISRNVRDIDDLSFLEKSECVDMDKLDLSIMKPKAKASRLHMDLGL